MKSHLNRPCRSIARTRETALPKTHFAAILLFILSAVLLNLVFPASARPEAGKILLSDDTFTVANGGWESYYLLQEHRPEFFVAEESGCGGTGSLGLYGASNTAVRGCWRKMVEGITPGAFYRFEARRKTTGGRGLPLEAFARLEWQNAKGEMIAHTKYYPAEAAAEGDWKILSGTYQTPENTAKVRLELYLSHSPQGRVLWDGISLAQVPAPPQRKVRLATVNCRPGGNTSSAQSVEEFCKLVDEAGQAGCDIICLGEGINLVGVSQPDGRASEYHNIAEPIPGPTTTRLGEVARKYKMYIVAALGERENQAVYNTAVLIGREGELKGKYRKVQVPDGELDQGCTPGNSWPVFDTDFGRIGMLICWDSWFVDPARALALKGAEIILMPIWGGDPTLITARAIENHVYLVSCGYDVASAIYDPWGRIIAQPEKKPGIAYADIDLNYPPSCPWSWAMEDLRAVLLHATRYDLQPEAPR
ncbi:MAG TPA: carbon-nitrogen hydrolase family protein [Candidatus Glassbacteria bacterium]|nr:carbon-nitrogen hydrolase family protein [Candidatus Glassbacteria bacterium]